jgi:hypothetical protein
VVLAGVGTHPGDDVGADGGLGIQDASSKDFLDDLVELEDVPTMPGSERSHCRKNLVTGGGSHGLNPNRRRRKYRPEQCVVPVVVILHRDRWW